MNFKLILITCVSIFTSMLLLADNRDKYPIQLQYLPTQGASFGVHLSERFYVGVSHTNRLSFRENTSYGFRYDDDKYGQLGMDEIEYNEGATTVAEVRYSPWDFGLYFSAGYLMTDESDIEVEFDKRLRRIGSADYNTSLTVKIEKEKWAGGALGLGYNHVFGNQISLGIGGLIGLTKIKTPDITVKTDSGVTLSSNDEDIFIEDIEKEETYVEGYGFISIGYNF